MVSQAVGIAGHDLAKHGKAGHKIRLDTQKFRLKNKNTHSHDNFPSTSKLNPKQKSRSRFRLSLLLISDMSKMPTSSGMTTEPPGQHPASQYAHTTAFDAGTLAVSEIHNLHYEQYGKQDGKPGESALLCKALYKCL